MNNFWNSLPHPILALAPMEGYTDSAFRQMAKSYGADVVYTEFISSDAIANGADKVLNDLSFDPIEQPVICQIFGRDVNNFRTSAKLIKKKDYAGIDINFGCPVRKVVGAGSGVALLRDPVYARKLIEAVLDITDLPVSIKVGASIRKERKEVAPGRPERYTAMDLVNEIKDLPVSSIMIHGRSFEDGFTGDIDTDMIKEVKNIFKGLVLANGGIQNPEDAKKLLERTSADGVGIARGSLGHPWIFKQIKDFFNTGKYQSIDFSDIKKIILKHAELAHKNKGDYGIIELRKHLSWYVKGVPGAAKIRAQLVRVNTIDEIKTILDETI